MDPTQEEMDSPAPCTIPASYLGGTSECRRPFCTDMYCDSATPSGQRIKTLRLKPLRQDGEETGAGSGRDKTSHELGVA